MIDYQKTERVCQQSSAISRLVIDDFLIPYAAKHDKLEYALKGLPREEKKLSFTTGGYSVACIYNRSINENDSPGSSGLTFGTVKKNFLKTLFIQQSF